MLDLLITWHHFLSHKDVDPGVLTDLRSASVSNENFAQIATRNNFDKYLQHGSGILSEKIKEYITAIANNQCGEDMQLPNGLPKAPKVPNACSLLSSVFSMHMTRSLIDM